jgi:hypothetical protein
MEIQGSKTVSSKKISCLTFKKMDRYFVISRVKLWVDQWLCGEPYKRHRRTLLGTQAEVIRKNAMAVTTENVFMRPCDATLRYWLLTVLQTGRVVSTGQEVILADHSKKFKEPSFVKEVSTRRIYYGHSSFIVVFKLSGEDVDVTRSSNKMLWTVAPAERPYFLTRE